MTALLNSTLCYLERDGQYLMLHRVKKQHDLNQGKWIGVGGKFLEGESPVQCLLREVLEETGFSLTSFRFRGLVTFVSDEAPAEYMFLFTADAWSGELHDCSEGVLQWIDKDRVPELNLWEGDRIFLQYLHENRPFFFLTLRYHGDQLIEASLENAP